MNATRISPTVYVVESESLTCTLPDCGFRTRSLRYRIGDACPRCARNKVDNWGVLERSTYQVDLEEFQQNGMCGCRNFETRLGPKLAAMSPSDQKIFRKRCKHIICARKEGKKDENFDLILAMLPNQETQV